MRKTYFSEVRRDDKSGRLAVIEYQYEPPESGDGNGKFFEVHFRPRLPWSLIFLLTGYLLALAGVELLMVEDNAKVGAGLLAVLVGGFTGFLAMKGVRVIAGKRISDQHLESDHIPIETLEAEEVSMIRTGSDPSLTTTGVAKPAKQQLWSPPTQEEFIARLAHALADAEDEEYRANVGIQCWTFMDRVWARRINAARARSQWNLFRYAGAVIPVVAAGAGGSLVGHLHGTVGTVIGLVALVAGLVGAAINAVRPTIEYGVDLKKSAAFEHLYWDVFNYAMAELPTVDVAAIPVKLQEFSQRMDDIAVISEGSTATSS